MIVRHKRGSFIWMHVLTVALVAVFASINYAVLYYQSALWILIAAAVGPLAGILLLDKRFAVTCALSVFISSIVAAGMIFLCLFASLASASYRV